MAVALLATFYGAAVANLFCLPIADKLQLKLHDEEINRTLIIDGMLMIREAKSPTLVREMLLAYLPERHRHMRRSRDRARSNAASVHSGSQRWRRKKAAGHGGGHGWFVTFADFMGLLVAFFVMLVAFSTQDRAKLQVVAGSMREAFGVQDRVRYSGIIEVSRPADQAEAEERSAYFSRQKPQPRLRPKTMAASKHTALSSRSDRNFSLAAVSLRQALQDMPELTEASKHIMLEETKQGLNIEIVDQKVRCFQKARRSPTSICAA